MPVSIMQYWEIILQTEIYCLLLVFIYVPGLVNIEIRDYAQVVVVQNIDGRF